MAVDGHQFFGYHARFEQDVGHWLHELARIENGSCPSSAKGEGVLAGLDFWDYFAEKEEDERKQNGLQDEFEPVDVAEIEYLREDVSAEHDYRDIQEVVYAKDGGKRALAVVAQRLDAHITHVFLAVEL